MRLLLDTHVVLWWRLDSPRLQPSVRREISDAEHVLVSAASAWEVAIKIAQGRLRLKEAFATHVEASGFDELPVTFRHAARFEVVPRHHPDPFDRMLIAQAQAEGLTLVTHDRAFEPYDVATVWT